MQSDMTEPLKTKRSKEIELAVQKTLEFKTEFLAKITADKNELEKFWLRKSRKIVLSVVLVEATPGKYETFKGVNMEVSLPTGALCAERNALGNALTVLPTLQRNQIRIVTVVALYIPTPVDVEHSSNSTTLVTDSLSSISLEDNLNPIWPCGVCSEWLRKITVHNSEFRVVSFKDASCSEYYVKKIPKW